AVDAQHLYWANASGNSVGRANLDGSAVDQSLASATDPYGVAADTSPQGRPIVGGERVLGVGQTSATVGAAVNPNGGATRYQVEWGPTAAYGSIGPELPSGAPLTGQSDQAVAAQLTGLSAGSTYHWRIVATNGAGTTAGADQTLTAGTAGPV